MSCKTVFEARPSVVVVTLSATMIYIESLSLYQISSLHPL